MIVPGLKHHLLPANRNKEPAYGEFYRADSSPVFIYLFSKVLGVRFIWWNDVRVTTVAGDGPFHDFDGWRYFKGSHHPETSDANDVMYGIYRVKL